MLQEDKLRVWCQRLAMPEEATEALAGVARLVNEDEALRTVFEAFHEKTAVRGAWQREWAPLASDPQVEAKLGNRITLFYLLAYMAALPYTERTYQARGIGMDIFADTMRDIPFYTIQAKDIHGYWCFHQFPWIWRHLSCELFRLGRLQYMLTDFSGDVKAFRNRKTGAVRMLCGPSIDLRADGYALRAGKSGINGSRPAESEPDESPWHANLAESPAGWHGNLIAPRGNVLRESMFLPREEWECILTKGDTVLDLHIPRASNLTVEDCRASFEEAHSFFARIAPERPFKALYCHTWMFTPQLQSLLPPESNIVKFQREFYLYPFAGGPSFLWQFVFGDKYRDPMTAPRDTSLRRDVVAWLTEGKELFDLPGVLFHEPEKWGTQPYMGSWEQG